MDPWVRRLILADMNRGGARWGRLAALRPRMPNRRGQVLLLFGGVYVTIGLATALMPIPPSSVEGYAVASTILPLPVWGFVWAACGVVGIVTAWWPAKRDDLGYYTMAGFGILWACLSASSTVVDGAGRGWVLALIWGAFASALMLVSGMDRDRE